MKAPIKGGRFKINIHGTIKSAYYDKEGKKVGLFSGREWHEWSVKNIDEARDKARAYFEAKAALAAASGDRILNEELSRS